MKKVGWILVTLLAVFIVFKINYGWLAEFNYWGKYQFMIKSDKDNVYDRLLFVQDQTTSVEFYLFLGELLGKSNLDFLTTEAACRYVSSNHVCFLKKTAQRKYDLFLSMPKDTSWTTKVKSHRYRGNGPSPNSALMHILPRCIKKLDQHCN